MLKLYSSLFFLLFSHSLGAIGASEGGYCSNRLREEAHKSFLTISKDEYGDTDRLFKDYKDRFDAKNGGFSNRLDRIKANGGVWIDGGARAAYPQRQFLRDSLVGGIHKDMRLLAFSVDLKPHLRAELDSEKKVFAGAFDSRIADLADVGALTSNDSFDVGTDYLGAFSYSQRPLEIFENYISHMKDDGALYIGTRDDLSFVYVNGKKVPLIQFIKDTVSGLNFEKLDEKLGIYRVTIKNRAAVSFPNKLILRDWKAGLPPERVYDYLYMGREDDDF